MPIGKPREAPEDRFKIGYRGDVRCTTAFPQIDYEGASRRLFHGKGQPLAASHCLFKNPSTSRLKSAGLSW
jgi:hypothetical protein